VTAAEHLQAIRRLADARANARAMAEELTEELAEAVRRAQAEVGVTEIARALGVSRRAVYDLIGASPNRKPTTNG
jgi:DNA invertase Pin-like site-specific DNA recombinase